MGLRRTKNQTADGRQRASGGPGAAGTTSGFDSILLVHGGSPSSLGALGEVTDASGYAAEQSLDAKTGAWTNNLVYGSFAAAGLTLLAITLPARRTLRRWS
ncbi:hypothetical protein [Streptomyces sp. NBC_00356]|uniref:hypothetical protein n=1 Tax=Streptomyces sp. NBC_00356 TaxID=2975724 RepID=UPI002E26D494